MRKQEANNVVMTGVEAQTAKILAEIRRAVNPKIQVLLGTHREAVQKVDRFRTALEVYETKKEDLHKELAAIIRSSMDNIAKGLDPSEKTRSVETSMEETKDWIDRLQISLVEASAECRMIEQDLQHVVINALRGLTPAYSEQLSVLLSSFADIYLAWGASITALFLEIGVKEPEHMPGLRAGDKRFNVITSRYVILS